MESGKGAIPFKNVIYSYSLSQAMADGFVKEPAVVTQKNFNPGQFTAEQLETIKLEDGVRLHESVKVELETYGRQTGQQIVKPFLLVIARDTTHAGALMQRIQSIFEGRYKDKVIQVDSSKTGAEEEEMIEKLLKVEHYDEPTEIVIHVNMLKEGWDVTNLYTIVPLRAANARILIEQSIGRGLRLPYGKRTGVTAVDRLNIVAHDRFQEIIDEANIGDSVIRLKEVILDPQKDFQKTVSVIAQPAIEHQLGLAAPAVVPFGEAQKRIEPVFKTAAEQKVAQVAYKVIGECENLPTSAHLGKTEVVKFIADRVAEELAPAQMELEGISEKPDVLAIVAKTTEMVVQQTIDIPRIYVVPKTAVTIGFDPFEVEVKAINFSPVERDLLIQHLRTSVQEFLTPEGSIKDELRMEDYLVRALIDYNDISYDAHADLLYDLAGQVVKHLLSYLKEEDKVRNVLLYYQGKLAELMHVQMQKHQWESPVEYEVKVSKGFTELKKPAYTVLSGSVQHFRQTVEDKGRIGQLVFGGFARCLYDTQKFQSDSERKFAVILETDPAVMKWLKPAKGQFKIFYKHENDQPEYVPDFVAETADCIYMCETKARSDMNDSEVITKKEAATKWCELASAHTVENGGKPWEYMLVPHDIIAENMTLKGLTELCT